MKPGPKKQYATQAEKQAAYRNKKERRDTVNAQLAIRTRALLEVARSRGIVLGVEEAEWRQVEELTAWLQSH